MSTLKLLNERIALESLQEELQGSLYLPQHRSVTHEIGRVIGVGDGVYRTGEKKPMWIKPGDIVLYQLGAPQLSNSMFKLDGKPVRVFHQGDVIAKLDKPIIKLEYFHVTGLWVLLDPVIEQGTIIVPEVHMPAENIKFKVVQKGEGCSGVPGLEIGDEVYPERGKCAPIELDGHAYVWTLVDFLYGIVKDDSQKDPK